MGSWALFGCMISESSTCHNRLETIPTGDVFFLTAFVGGACCSFWVPCGINGYRHYTDRGTWGTCYPTGRQKWHRRATRTLQAIGHKTVSLTGWWFQPLWKIWVSWGDEIPNTGKNPIKTGWWLVVLTIMKNMSQWEGLSQLLVVYLPLWKYEFVSWDDSSQYMENHKIPWFQTTNQLSL